ncbi:MAG: ComEC/Rec2 family competence protein [Candidatus Omnitrophica bacterium]|nr:ComEC/Rec2 family competence protein [Candidatus Omnitrophota bacterium]
MGKKSHRPFMVIFIAFAFGIIAGEHFSASPGFILPAAFCLTVLCFFLRGFPKAFDLALGLYFVLAGFIYIQDRKMLSPDDIYRSSSHFFGREATVEGVITTDPSSVKFRSGTKTSFALRVLRARTSWGDKKVSGTILVNIFSHVDFSFGDQIIVKGKLHEPFEYFDDNVFSYRDYLRHRGIRLICSVKKINPPQRVGVKAANPFSAKIYKLRNALKEKLDQFLTANESAIMRDFLLGDRTSRPKIIDELFVRTGTVHILAISGLHVVIVSSVVLFILKMFPLDRRISYLLTILAVLCYCQIAQSRPSVVRATIMICVILIGLIIEKDSDILNSLFLSGFIILLFNPFNIFDAGFQLSFICVLAIILFFPEIHSLILAKVRAQGIFSRAVIESISLSVAVWLSVLGLIAYCFRIITPVTILANLIAVPISYVLLVLGVALLLVSFLNPWLASIVAVLVKISLNLMVGSVFLLSKIPFAYIKLKGFDKFQLFISYLIVLLILWLIKRLNRKQNIPLKDTGQMI